MEDTKARVLIVDDEEALRIGVQRILEMEGYDVDTASNGTEGIEKGSQNDYDLAVLDLKMPDISGIEVLRAIRLTKPETICFMATAFASYETAIEATKLGAYGYILKPFTDDELLRNLEMGLERRQLLLESKRLKEDRERRLLELAFERSRLNTVIHSLADGVLVINKDNEVVYFNPAALKLLNLDDIEIEKNILPMLPSQVNEMIQSYLEMEKYEPKSSSVEMEINPEQKLVVEVTCSPVPHPDGTLAGVVIVLSNITKFKEIEQLKSQFVSMVSHELKAPVAATIGFLNLLNDKKVNLSEEKREDFVKRSIGRLHSLLSMVNDLLDISRMELKSVKREMKLLSLNDILQEVANLFTFEANKKSIDINLTIPDGLPQLKADPNELQRLFTNLVSNGIKYNKEGGELNISVQTTARYLVTEVSDTGIGMREEDQQHLFSEFFRAKNQYTKNIHGTGLGMSIVQKLVDSYSGKIEFESEYGKGTAFKIYLPHNQSTGS